MALIVCKECKKDVSDKARECPHCGAPVAKKSGCLSWFLGAVGVFILFLWWASSIGGGGTMRNATSSPPERQPRLDFSGRDAQTTRQFTLVPGLRTIAATRDPDSYIAVRLLHAESGKLEGIPINEGRGAATVSQAFRIKERGRYVLNVHNVTGAWSIVIE